MKWAGTVYGVHLLTSAAAIPELCRWEHWQKAFPIVDRLMTMSPATAAIRTGQTFDNESHWLGFGRMIWSRKNNEKWTQKYRSPQFADRQLNFLCTEIWAPDWNVVWRDHCAPDIFVKLATYTPPQIRQSLLVAVREPIYSSRIDEIRPLVAQLASLLPDADHRTGHQRWAEKVYGSGGFSDGLSNRTAFRLADQLVRAAV